MQDISVLSAYRWAESIQQILASTHQPEPLKACDSSIFKQHLRYLKLGLRHANVASQSVSSLVNLACLGHHLAYPKFHCSLMNQDRCHFRFNIKAIHMGNPMASVLATCKKPEGHWLQQCAIVTEIPILGCTDPLTAISI